MEDKPYMVVEKDKVWVVKGTRVIPKALGDQTEAVIMVGDAEVVEARLYGYEPDFFLYMHLRASATS